MAGFGVQPQKIAIGVGFRWFARFLDPPNIQFQKKFSPHFRNLTPTATLGRREVAGFGVRPQNIVIGVGFRWFSRFLDPPTSNFEKKAFHSTLMSSPVLCVDNQIVYIAHDIVHVLK